RPPVRVVSFDRNGWSACSEMAGQIGPKRLVRFERNGWSDSTEIRTQAYARPSPDSIRVEAPAALVRADIRGPAGHGCGGLSIQADYRIRRRPVHVANIPGTLESIGAEAVAARRRVCTVSRTTLLPAKCCLT